MTDDLPGGPAARWARNQQQARQQAAEQRRARAQQLLQDLPAAMRALPQWLLWREVPREGKKPLKMPCYARTGFARGWPKGRPRDGKPSAAHPQVPQGDALDRAELVTLEEAVQMLLRRPDWAGVGFAFLPGDGLIGVDIDHAVADDGTPSDLCTQVIGLCGSYTEISPSGRGVHIIVQGETTTFKDDAIGLEVYCNAQYFTCTGRRPVGPLWPQTPADVQAVDPLVIEYLRTLVMESRERQQQQRLADARGLQPVAAPPAAAADAAPAGPAEVAPAVPAAPAAAPAPAEPAPRPRLAAVHGAPVAPPPARGGDDFRRVNEAAMQSLGKWVPKLFADAREWRTGYRVTSKSLGRDLQEDLAIQADGIVDWGVADLGDARQGKRSPVDLVMEWGARVGVPAGKPAEALRWLAQALDVQVAAPQRMAPPPAGRARPAAQRQGEGLAGQPTRDDGPPGDDPPPEDAAEDGGAPAKKRRGAGKVPAETWELVEALCERFALVYGTDTAWDKAELMLVRIPAMRLAFGKTAVNLWLSRPAPQRRMVRPVDLVFEPGANVQPPQINMWAGLDLQPRACDRAEVQPMLDLLRHLCAETRIDGDPAPVDTAMRWVLSWQALPLQRPGTKMRTACVFHGAQGTGKNLFWDAWRDLFGIYGITVGQTELEDKYNGWISRKQAILGDEVVSRQELYHNKNRLKLVVTQQEKFAIRGMFMETRWESNHANVVFLSNENIPLVLEDRDRRYMVIFTPLEADAALYQRVRDFLADDGLAKWMHYLLHYECGDFDAHAKPPMTKAKEALIEASWRPPARFAYEWLEGYIDLPVRVCSAEQLYRAFRRWCDLTGARWPADQATFTAELNRWVRERVRRVDGRLEEPALTYKQISLRSTDTEVSAGVQRRTVRCFVPRGCQPMNGVTEGAWAWDSVRTFEDDLARYRGAWGKADRGDE